MARISKKYNDACLKIFALLNLLADGDADFSDVIKIFADANGEITSNSNVLLNKYLNTIKIFGVDVEKVKNKYILKHMPFSLSLNETDLQGVALIGAAVNFLPDGKNKNNIIKLLRDLENLYDNETRKLKAVISSNKNYDLSFYFKKFETQIAECENYLQNSCKLEILYVHNDRDDCIMCIPKEIKYHDTVVSYSVYNTLSRQVVDIPMGSIKNIRKVSEGINVSQSCTTVIFKLKEDLAVRYKLRDWEHSTGKDENGWLVVVNSGEDFDMLCSRLLRYDDKCVIVSPDYLKNKMTKIIDDMLSNYGE